MTSIRPLRPLRVLVAEDEFLIAVDLVEQLQAIGADVVGMEGSLADVQAVVQTGEQIDVAVLDINLHGEMVWPVADELIARGVPVVFTTGYDASAIPSRYAAALCCEKPVCATALAKAIDRSARRQPAL